MQPSAPDDKTALIGGQKGATAGGGSEAGPLYYDSPQSPQSKLLQLSFMVTVVLLVLISIILSIYQSVTQRDGLYVMLGLSLIGLLVIEIFMILFIRHGDLPADKSWFLYVVGVVIALESIFTDVLLFTHG